MRIGKIVQAFFIPFENELVRYWVLFQDSDDVVYQVLTTLEDIRSAVEVLGLNFFDSRDLHGLFGAWEYRNDSVSRGRMRLVCIQKGSKEWLLPPDPT